MKYFAQNIYDNYIFNLNEVDDFFTEATAGYEILSRSKIKYINLVASFDIETTSFYVDNEKRCICYAWAFGLNGRIIRGRTTEEFVNMINHIAAKFGLKDDLRLCVYVHSLAYEFQFICKWFKWKNVFALSQRKPIYCVTENNIEFRCSYLLTNFSLEKVGEHLQTYKFEKMVGDLDYSMIRNSQTDLTETEWNYLYNDVRIVMAHIQEQIDSGEDLKFIPLTNTGYVRRFIKEYCFYEEGVPKKKSIKKKRYHDNLMKFLTLDFETYMMLKAAFQGGFTHGNPGVIGETLTEVASMDFTSAYPYVLLAEKYPMSAPEDYKVKSMKDLYHQMKCYCCLFEIELFNVKPTVYFENYISVSKCSVLENYKAANGRLVSADKLRITITEQDFYIIEKFYTWDNIRIGKFKRFKKAYLPTDLVKAILSLYRDKTLLKGVEGKEQEYMNKKGMLNSTYGCCVTDILRNEDTFNEEGWITKEIDPDKELDKYNKSYSRFLYYAWGVWVTAYNRNNLLSSIYTVGNKKNSTGASDYAYSDTDSIKFTNYESHKTYFDKYNRLVEGKLRASMEFHKIDFEECRPLGKMIGIFDCENQKGKSYAYDRYMTLGAKRYIVDVNGKISITVSGLNKKVTVPYLYELDSDPFNVFKNGLHVPPGKTGKMTHTYIDDDIFGELTDYQGHTAAYHEKSFVHLENTDYTMGISEEFIKYCTMVKER